MARYIHLQLAMDADKHRRKVQRRQIRDFANPFEMPCEEFRHIYRVRKEMALYLCHELEVDLRPRHNDGLPVFTKVLTSLHLLADGNYQRGTGQDHGLCVAQSTVSVYLGQFIEAVHRRLLGKWIIFPGSERRRRAVAQGFADKFGVPNILGAIDCTHVKIFPPPQEQKAQYRNRKGTYTMNVQLVADVDCRIIAVNSRYPGRVHDSFIFQYSTVKDEMRRLYDQRIGDYFLLGDSGYALEPWLMTPVLNARPDSPEERYTSWHCWARNTVERTNGYVKNVFRCIGFDRVLHYDPAKASGIINTCCVLYNIMHHFRCLPPEIPLVEEGGEDPQDPGHGLLLRVAENKRTRIINNYFGYYIVLFCIFVFCFSIFSTRLL